MKTKGDRQGSIMKKFLFSNFFTNLYYFFVMHIYVVLSILGVCLAVALLLFVAEIVMPGYVHLFNYSLTDKTFSQLVKSHRYHAAVAFVELKDSLVLEGNESYKYRIELADCYVHIGDYSKALEQYDLLCRQVNDDQNHDGMPEDEFKMIKDFNEASLAKGKYRIYLKMGDKANILEQYNIINKKYSSTDWTKTHEILSESLDELNDILENFDLRDGFRLELLQGEYMMDPASAIPKMEEYAIGVNNSKKCGPGYKLTVLSELVRMLLEQERTIAARYYLESALAIVDAFEYESAIYPFLGDLSDYCYRMNDIRNGRRLLKKYLYHIDDTYDKQDIDYAVAHAKEFKYLEADGNWKELNRRLDEASKSLREQIAKNFTGMTSAQREYFIEQFMPLFSYANDLLATHPSEQLARICFENNLFLRGLLLRSESVLANSIAAIGDPELTDKYHRYVELSQEMVARQYISGPGNSLRKSRIEKEISELETYLAGKSREFRRNNEKGVPDIENLNKSLSEGEVAMQIVQSAKEYLALLLTPDGKVRHVRLGDVKSLNEALASNAATYGDAVCHSEWVGRLLPLLKGRSVYYCPDGIFNKVSLSSLPVDDNGTTLGDMAMINLTGSLTDIASIKESRKAFNLLAKNAVLWGGIDYGAAKDSVAAASAVSDVVLRGEELRYLPGSKAEVVDLARMLNQGGSRTILYTGSDATEKTLLSRSRKKDYILHISTHGFFRDTEAFVNPMRNTGLLFAHSQSYWMDDAKASSISEDDGILRADEIAGLDLSGCRLVVLSACRTGLGESNSEGVYGLQRAFKLAGAQSILMSLWSVDDAATHKLMTSFYSELLSGNDPRIALAKAQNRMRGEGYSPDKWAGFVLLD